MEPVPADPGDPGFIDDGAGGAVVVEPIAATPGLEEGPAPHADRPNASAATTATSAAVPHRRAGSAPRALQAVL